ncbi:MAG: hypothetical protein CMF69_08380, partial [Magnetovibrio sp.]|nr:hypothetical protein [Magnetovibrio sp.]
LLGLAPPIEVVWVFITAMVGIFALSAACIGWLFVDLTRLERIVFLSASLMLIQPSWKSDSAGFVIFTLITTFIFYRAKRGENKRIIG